MNRVLYYCSYLLLFAGLYACKKTADSPARNPDKLRISKITQTTASAPQTKGVTDFIYDDQQRVKRIVSIETVNNTPTTQPGSTLSFYYSDSGKNPYRASGQVSSGWIADIFYTYNNAGLLIRDSAINAGATQIRTHDYTYSTDKIIVKKGYYSTGSAVGSTLTDSVVIKNNNIAEIVYSTGSIGQSAYYFQLSYDDKINPLSKLNIAAVKVTEGITGFPDNMAPGFCKNNIKSYATGTISYSGQRVEKATQPYVFTYTKEGLPETCTITTQLDTYIINYSYEEF